ncbi:MAG: hypothetical protein EA349_15940 [Halomonadaceae bacterium]|nr:MAG: hypothetical protein EA349_15940 [Halomonadaceae bacterium]
MSYLEAVPVMLVLVVAASILWSTWRYGMSPMPSLGKARQAMLAQVTEPPRGDIVDMGSGWGTLAIPFARRFPHTRVVGYEVSWFPWAVSVLLARVLRLENLHFYRQDFRQADLTGASVLLCYLMAQGMVRVSERLQQDPGAVERVVSHHFALPGWQPSHTHYLADIYATPIYSYSVSNFT